MWKVLIVEDNTVNSSLLRATLDNYAKCDVVANGKEAFKVFIEKYDEKYYDIFLVDIAMPEMDGVKLCTLIKEYEDFMKVEPANRLPVVIVTAHENRLKELFSIGYNDFVLKPLDPYGLIEKMKDKIDK